MQQQLLAENIGIFKMKNSFINNEYQSNSCSVLLFFIDICPTEVYHFSFKPRMNKMHERSIDCLERLVAMIYILRSLRVKCIAAVTHCSQCMQDRNTIVVNQILTSSAFRFQALGKERKKRRVVVDVKRNFKISLKQFSYIHIKVFRKRRPSKRDQQQLSANLRTVANFQI